MFKYIIKTDNEVSSLILRLFLGIVFFPHGMQKLLGWFGGYGFSATMNNFTQSMGIPYFFALLAVIAESFGAMGLITGFLTRIAAFGISCVMIVAILTVHIHNGFFMNWFGNKTGEGYEYHLLAIGIAVAIILKGGGKWSLDRIVYKKYF
jgi:putative oxidoreductase